MVRTRVLTVLSRSPWVPPARPSDNVLGVPKAGLVPLSYRVNPVVKRCPFRGRSRTKTVSVEKDKPSWCHCHGWTVVFDTTLKP